jgi:hypothetical protein
MEDRERPWGLPEVALTVGSSWAAEDACGRRWYFARAEGLKPIRRSAAPRFGDGWHAIMEDIHRWWMHVWYPDKLPYTTKYLNECAFCEGRGCRGDPMKVPPCSHCGGTGRGPVMRLAEQWSGTDLEDRVQTIARAAEGWLEVYGGSPEPGWSVIGVEAPLAFPIPSPGSRDGRPYMPHLPVVTRPDGSRRLARTGEAKKSLPDGWSVAWERVPAWVSVRLDSILRSPNGGAWVGEWKSSRDPARYFDGLPVDPQCTVYELALEHAIRNGSIWMPGPGRSGWPGKVEQPPVAAGWIYDVVSSVDQRDLKPLKKPGEVSTSQQFLGSVPSWRLRADLARRGIPVTAAAGEIDDRPVTWSDRIADAVARIDGRFYLRENGSSPAELRRDVLLELYAIARQRAGRIRAAANAETDADLRLNFPRVAVCRAAGAAGCPFHGPCVLDGPEARRWFVGPTDIGPDTSHEEAPDADDAEAWGE